MRGFASFLISDKMRALKGLSNLRFSVTTIFSKQNKKYQKYIYNSMAKTKIPIIIIKKYKKDNQKYNSSNNNFCFAVFDNKKLILSKRVRIPYPGLWK